MARSGLIRKTSPFSFYQFWRNTADEDVIKFIKTFTFLPTAEVAELSQKHAEDPGKRLAHMALAREVTLMVHGQAGLEAAQRISAAMFANSLSELGQSDFEQLAQDGMESSALGSPGLMDVLVDTGLAVTPRGEVTRGQARKLIEGNSILVNGERVTDVDMELTASNALFGKYFVVQKGKKNHHLVVVGG